MKVSPLVAAWAAFERGVTREVIRHAAAFRLAGVSHPSVEQLGGQGPWLVDRLIGAREIADEMDTAGKVHAVGASVRRATLLPEGWV